MESFPFEIIDGHVVAHINDKKVLIDTGSPLTFGDEPALRIMGENHPVADSLMGKVTAGDISDYLHTRIDVLLGGDIFRKFPFLIHWNEYVISFGAGIENSGGLSLQVRISFGVPVIPFRFHGREHLACFDTGAKLSYFDPSILEGYDPIGEASDFYPIFGRFHTAIYELPIEICGESVSLRSGKLPDELRAGLVIGGFDSVVGTELFQAFPKILFNYQAGSATFWSG